MKGYRRILHPTDFSAASAAALRRAVELARAGGGQLILAHAMAPVVPMAADEYVSPTLYRQMESAGRREAQKQLDRLVARARKAGVRVTSLLLEGSPADQIVRAARSKRADVIVMGTHGRTGLARLFLGSVAERVVGTAPCPVLTVRGKRPR